MTRDVHTHYCHDGSEKVAYSTREAAEAARLKYENDSLLKGLRSFQAVYPCIEAPHWHIGNNRPPEPINPPKKKATCQWCGRTRRMQYMRFDGGKAWCRNAQECAVMSVKRQSRKFR
jgi:hypothetical protein